MVLILSEPSLEARRPLGGISDCKIPSFVQRMDTRGLGRRVARFASRLR